MSPRTLIPAVFVLLALFGAATPVHAADTPFSTRYAQTLRGNVTAIGNQNLSCPTAATGCVGARGRTGTNLNNNDYTMSNVDVDSDAATFNSSSANLSLPAGATVTWAGLYWAADTSAGSSGAAAPSAASRGSVRFQVGSGDYATVTAATGDLLTSTSQTTRFRGFANVTSQVAAAGSGRYGVANIQAGRGADRFAGWSLIVAYRDAGQDIRRLQVFDGLGTVDGTHTFSTNIAPFFTPSSGPVHTTAGLLSFEGDASIASETMKLSGSPLTDAMNPANNPMNSTQSVDGTLYTDKNPSYGNTMGGVDVDVFSRTGLLANNQSSATLAFTSTQDYYMPSALWLVSDEGPAVNSSGPSIGGVARDGSTLTVSPGAWNGTPTITYEYQWQRCDASGSNCVDIPGATGSTYTLGPDDVGSTVRVVVTAVNDAGSSDPATSGASGTVAKLAPSNAAVPTVTGVAEDDRTLTTTTGGWNGTGPLDYDVQWQRCDASGNNCVDIPGETGSSYILTGADVGATIRSVVTASNAAGSATSHSVPTGTVDPVAPAGTVAPQLSGLARDGQTLGATTGTWTGTDPVAYAYQWQRCDAGGGNCADIAGETGSSYDLAGADIGHTVRVQVTATNVAGHATASSAPTTVVIPDPPANAVAPALSGTAQDGSTLTLDDGSWTGTHPLAYTYQWQRCDADGSHCVDIAGEIGSSYIPGPADVGHAIVVVVTATNPGGSTTRTSAPSTPVSAAPPASASPPSVSGDPSDGATLTVDPGTWTGTQPDLTYQWQRCDADGTHCADIAGETGSRYVLGSDDVDHAVTVVVTATNAAGDATSTAPATHAVAASPPHDTSLPVIGGTVAPGGTLTAGDGTWSGTTPVDFTYQWQRCDADGSNCVDIPGETGSSYTLGDDDLGHTVVVVVTATNAAGTDTSTSAPSAVLPAPPANTTPPVISGTDKPGSALTADPGTWSGTGPFDYTYQWQRCDSSGNDCVDIPGETGSSYVLGSEDVGHTIKVVVSASNAAGSDSATAPASPAVKNPKPTPTHSPSPSPSPTPSPTPTPPPGKPKPASPLSSGKGTPTGPVSSAAAFGGLGGADLGSVPGSLVSDTSCQQLLGNSKYRRVEAKGIGTVRLRAYAKGPATKNSPVRVTTQITHGKAKRVAYKLDGRKLKAKRKGRWNAVITPQKLERIGVHKLVATVKGKKKKAKKVLSLKLKTVTCRTLFTAQRWRTFSGAGLRLRIDSRSAMQGIIFKVPGALLPRQLKQRRVIGFMRVFVAGEGRRRRYSLKLAKQGKKTPLVRGAGKPTVKLGKGKITVTGLPGRVAVAELTLYRLRKLDGAPERRAFKLRARVVPTGTALSVRTKRLR